MTLDPTDYWYNRAVDAEAEVERLRAELEVSRAMELDVNHAMRPVVDAARAWAEHVVHFRDTGTGYRNVVEAAQQVIDAVRALDERNGRG